MENISFICIGAQKAGTTTLHDILSQHPGLQLPNKKETHFFSNQELYKKGRDFYKTYFKDSVDGGVFGEIDPEYSYNMDSAKRIHSMFGKTKIIFILRNPVERAYSHFLMTKRRGLEDFDFEQALELEGQRISNDFGKLHFSYCSRGYYLEQLMNYENIFGSENLKVVIFEDFVKDIEKQTLEISDFIGLPKFNYSTMKVSNPASSPRVLIFQKILYSNNAIKKSIGKIISSKEVKRKIAQRLEKFNLKKTPKKELPEELRKKIFEKYFKDEVEKLENKLELNLSIWKL